MPGVRAEPKYLRDPTSFETLSSGLSRLSSYVSNNLPKIKTSTAYPPAYAPPQDPQLLFYQQQLLQQRVAAAAATTGPQTNMEPSSLPSATITDASPSDQPTSSHKKQQQGAVETITVAQFEKVDTLSSGMISCLLLGYEHGFQLWNVTQPDNIHELVSVREDSLGTVIQLHVLAPPLASISQDIYAHQRPLLAIICSDTSDESSTTSTTTPNTQHHRRESSASSTNKNYTTRLHLYSLRTHEFIPMNDLTLPQDDMVLTNVKSNGRVIALGCKNQHGSAIHLLLAHDLSPAASPLTDIYNHRDGPVFTLGSRLLAYATTLPVLNNNTTHRNHVDKDVKVAAKDIAKEMVNGVKSLGEFGYHRLSNYFSPQQQQQQYQDFPNTVAATSPIGNNQSSDAPYYPTPSSTVPLSPSPGTAASSSSSSDQKAPSSSSSSAITGMVIIRDLTKLPTKGSTLLSLSTVAHFKPHMHPLAILAFNPAGNLLMSVSKQGHTFHVFSLYSPDKHLGNAGHLYNLSRGYTDAQVEDCQFSIDSTWCAVTTARGTSHMYTINPYGGKPEINGHVNGKINNLTEPHFAAKRTSNVTSLGPAVRVKQRRPMPVDNAGGTPDDLTTANSNLPTSTGNALYPTSISSTSSPPPPPGIFRLDINFNSQRNQSQQQHQQQNQWSSSGSKHRANLTTMFLSVARVPQQLQPHSADDTTFHNDVTGQLLQNPALYSSTSSIPTTAPANPTTASLASLKNQASTLVSQVSSYLPSTSTTQRLGGTDWTSAKDKTSDNRMFGFDEEESSLENEDTVTKMTNDNTGYQDLYSFHPQGILTLHRLWITKNLVRKKVQGRTVGKWDLSVKEEDIAEWQVARSFDWPEVGIPLTSPSLSTSSSSSSNQEDEGDSTDLEASKPAQKNKNKNKKKQQQQQQQQEDQQQRRDDKIDKPATMTNSQWLSHAEIMTYATANHHHPLSSDAPLWLNPQFAFQVYLDDPGVRSLLASGKVPPTQPVAIRSETPEPYSSRINRVGKTTAKSRSLENQEEDGYMDDALAELEENLSTAMQTSFAPSSSSSPRRGGIRLSSSATPAAYSSSTGSQKARTSSLSFEDAYLISMGGAPVYRSVEHKDDELYPPDTALIRFDSDDEDDDARPEAVSYSSLDGSFDIQGLDLDDNDPKRPIDVVFSPDGDNEIGGPSDSVLLGT